MPHTHLANLLGRHSHSVKHFLIVPWDVAAVERVKVPAAVWWCAGPAAEEVRRGDNAWSTRSSALFYQARGHTREEKQFCLASGGLCDGPDCVSLQVCMLVANHFPSFDLSIVYFCISGLQQTQRHLNTSDWQMCFDNTHRDKHLVSRISPRDTFLFTPTLPHRGDA